MKRTALLLAASILAVSASDCPDEPGWFQAGSSCYLMSQEKMTWFAAQEFCWRHGGYLAEIQSDGEEDEIDDVIIHGVVYWIGLSDNAMEGRYVWSESHQLADYTNWGPGEPQQDEGFDCVFKSGDFIVGWHDYNCNQDVVSGDAWGLQIHALCETETNN